MANKDFLDPYNLYGDTAEQPEQKQSLFNDLGNIISGINKTRQITRQDRELNELKWKYTYDPNLTEEEQDRIANEYNKKYEEMYKNVVEMQKNKKYLENAGSVLGDVGKHALSAGSSLEAMQGQYEANLLGAGLGFLLTGGNPAGAAAGWKIANVPSAIRANVQDAEAGAYETWNDVLEKTGDIELARQAYYDALKPNLAWSAPAIAADIAIGSGVGKGLGGIVKGSKLAKQGGRLAKMMEMAENSRLAKGLGGIGESRFGKAIGNIANKLDLDLGEGAGAYVAGKLNNPLAGKVARAGVNLLAEDASEILQESEQGISQKLATERALHQYDPTKYTDNGELTIGKVADWVTSPEGRETILDTAVATTLTGSAPVAIGAFNRLNAGYNYKSNLQQADNIVNDIQRGAINIDNEVYSGIKNAIGAANGLDDSQTSALSDKDVIRQVLEDNTDRAISMGMNEKDANAFAVNETIKLLNGEVATTPNLGYTTATTEAFAKQHGLDISNLTNMEKRRQQEQEARQKALTQAKEAHEGTIAKDVSEQSYAEARKNGEIDKDGNPINKEEGGQKSSSSLSSVFSNGFGQHWHVRQNAVDSNGNEYDGSIAIVDNDKTGRVVQLQKLDDGRISALDITPEGAKDESGKPVEASTKKGGRLTDTIKGKRVSFGTDADGIAALTKYMISQENETRTLKQEQDQVNNEVKVPDPNRRRAIVNSVHDLSDFYRDNKDLMDRDTFMMTARAMLAFGNGNTSIDLDLENQQAGKRGETDLPKVQNGVAKAIIHLYSGADAMTVVHEFAHVGYDMMSANDKLLFNQMALASETEFVCSLLRENFPMFKGMDDNAILQLILKKDKATLVAANEVGAIRQTLDIINENAGVNENGEDRRQIACEERYAWEFSTWYASGYTKGIAPDNQIHYMLDKTMHSLGKALNLISTIAARLQSPNWQAIQSDRSMVTMFENMNTRTFDTGGRDNIRRMYGGLRTQGEQQGQVQEQQQMPSTEEQMQSNDSLQPSLFSSENMNQEQQVSPQVNPTYIQQELFDNNSGNTPNVVTTNRNRQRREQDIQSQNERMQPVYINELNKIVNKNRNVTREEVDMVMNLSDDNYQKYAKKVLASKNPNQERLELLSYVDQSRGNMFAERIREKLNDSELDNVLFPKARTKSGKENAEQVRSNRVSNNEVVDSLETQVENRINNIVNKLIELDQKGEKSLNGYISKNKDKFESKTEGVHVYKEALKRFKKNREKYRAIRQKENERFAADDKQRKEQELQDYLSQNEEGIQDKYKKLMDKYEKDGLEAVKKTMDSPAIKKDPRLWNEAYSRLQKDVQEREEQRKAEEAKAFEEDVQKVLGLIDEKKKKGEGSLKMFLINKKFKTDPAYIEAKKRFNAEQQPVAQEKKEVQQPNPQPQPQQKQQPVEEVSQEVQEQPQQQAGEQVAEVERPKKGVSKEEFEEGLNKLEGHQFRQGNGISYDEQLEIEKELFGEVGKLSQAQFDELNYTALEVKDNQEEVEEEKPVAKEEENNGKTEDSGRVGDLRVPQGTLQGGGNSRSSTNQQPVLQPRQRVELEGTEARHGEDVSLLNKTEEKPKTKPKAEPKQEKVDNSDILMGKNGKPIGSVIAEVNGKDSKTTQRLVKEAYDGKEPTDLFGWRNITKGTNKDGDNAVAIFNKLFGTKLKPEDYYGGNIYVNKEGTAGYAVNANGFCTIEVSGKQKGLLANTILVARSTKGVNYIVANTDGFAMASICSRLGFSPSGILSINGEQKLVLAKEDLQEEDLAKKISNTKYEKIDTEDIPIFYGVEGLQNYESIVATSADKKQLTRKEQRTVFERVVRAVEGFPNTSTDELQYLIESIDKTLDNKNSKSKINTENLYLMNVLKSAAQEEIGNRGEDVQRDSEGEIVNDYSSVLESLYGAQELAELRKQSKGDTETAQELLSKAMRPWLAREEKEQNATQTEADNNQIESKNAKQTDTAKSDLGSILDKLEKGLEEMDKQQDYAKRVLEAEEYQEANLEDFDVDEDFGNLTDEELESRMSKSKKTRAEEKKETKSEQEEEIEAMEASEDEIPKDAKPKNVHIVNKNVKQINRYDTEDDWHRVCMSTITSDQGRNTGIKESEDVIPSEVRDFLNRMKEKYEKGSATTLEEGILGRDIDEEDKKELGRIYRKLCRQKLLMDERFTKGLYGDWTDKTGDIFHIRTHAVNYYKRLNRSLLGRVKMIMRNNGIHAFEYGFDEKDTKKKLTQKKLNEQRRIARNLQGQIDQLKATREALKGQEKTRAQRNKLRRTISLLEDALNEIKISVWANGQDMQGLTGKNKFRQEYAELREAAERAIERRKEKENRPAKNVDRDLENSRRKGTVRKKQKEAEQRQADSTPTLNSELTIDNSMRGNEVNWKKYVGNKKEQVSPILKGDKVSTVADLLKFKSVPELVEMARQGQDVDGMLNKINYMINTAVRYTQIDKNKAQQLKDRVADFKKAFNEALTAPQETPQKKTKTTAKKNKSTPTTKTTAPTTTPTTMSDEVYENMKKEIFDNLTGKTETLKKMTTEQLVKKIESASGQKLTPRQIKNLGNRLKAEQDRPPRKTKENKTNKSNTNQAQKEKTVSEKKTPTEVVAPVKQEKNPIQKIREKEEQERKENVQMQLDKLNNSKYVKNWIKGKVTKASDIISKLRNVQELKKIFDKGVEYRDGIDQAWKEIQEVIGALERLGEITKEERKQIGDKMDAINYEVIKQAEAEEQNQQPAKTTASGNEETIQIHPVRGLTRTLLSDEEQLLKNHKYGERNFELMKLLNDNVNNARTDEEKLDALILHNKHFFNLSMISQEKELRKKLGRPKQKTTNSKQNKTNGRKRSQETDTTIPETAVEENRDVYSITFTKDALGESKVKRDMANKYEKNDKYWKTERNADGSITFTRQQPLPHHTKNITYSGMNGKKVEKNKFDKLSQAWNWFADTMTGKWFNDNDAIKKIAAMVGATEAWMRFVVTKDIGSVATSAIERGIIKHNSKTHERTASLKSIANAIPKDKQWKFLEYCQAYRVLYDLAPKGIEQNMKPDEAQNLINEVESSEYGKLFKEQREKFVEYNKELLHVLVDGDIISEDFYQALVRDHPNFIPLSKDMSDFDSASDFGFTRKSLINVNNPLHRIGSSDREMKNPLLEMQKRTFDYYQRAADNKAARIFIDEIVNKITTNAEGDEVLLNQAILHKLKPQYKKDGTIKDISDPNKGIFYVMKDGKKEFYQLSDASVYKALRSMSPEQMTQFGKFVRWALSRPAAFVRFFATFTPDFGFGNLIRDNGEAFLTSRHGFIPLYDSLWGMWQMYTDSEWFKEYNSQVGEMGTRMRESERVAIDSQTMQDKVKNSMFVSPFFTLNEYLEQGTRIGEYKNARMGYKGTLGRLTDSRSTTLAEADKSGKDKVYAAYRSKDITLDFQQHGEWSKEVNKYIPFFNASMQGLYKVLNFIDEAVHNKEGMRAEFLLKASLISFLAISAGIHGAGDDDYEEAPDWEKDNYYVLGNGLRIPKDQVLGKLIGNSMELLGYQMAKGEIKLDEAGKQLVHDIKNAVIPDNLMPAFINLAIGVAGDYDMFRQKHITPEYLQNKISYLQKDLSTSQVSSDLSWAIYQATGAEIGAKKINFAFDNLFSNTMKYVNRMYDFVKEEATGKKANQKVGHMYLDADSKWSSDYLTSNTGSNVMDTTLDIMKMMVGKKFIQNQTSFKSVENFNEEYRRLKRLSSDPEEMTKQEQKLFTQFYEPAMKKIKANQKKLSEINKNESWDKTQKLEKARPIILKNIEIARWANSKSKA